ncbi:S-Ena type endospore appendage [Bacillus sp. EAC]|uniref:S-Ena type endospore appendage n=1 Tax=Bacillus sp. EAC TaxID=1978338 RepID=UPI000B430721|nr:S-Ena type endospore appendage [Bacillus sp. EAC]
MSEENHRKCDCEKEVKKCPPPPRKPTLKPPSPPPFPKPKPPSPPTPIKDCFPKQCHEMEIICTKICGNILLDQDFSESEIWKKKLNVKGIVSVSVFNSTSSTDSLKVLVNRMGQNPVVFTVPRGNTLAVTVEDITSVTVVREGEGTAEGTFCLEIYFPIHDKKFY